MFLSDISEDLINIDIVVYVKKKAHAREMSRIKRSEARDNSSPNTRENVNGKILKEEAPGAKDFKEDTLSDASAARKPVDVSNVRGGVQNRFKNAAADRTSNLLFYGRCQKRRFKINSLVLQGFIQEFKVFR